MESNRIKELRVNSGLTLRELSSLIHVDYSYLSKLEKNQKNLTKEMSFKLADFFSVDERYIEGKEHYSITCYTSDLKQTFSLESFEVKRYGKCYKSKLSSENKIINIVNKENEEKILNDKEEFVKVYKKLMNEMDIINSMDNWMPINLMIAKEKIDRLLEEYNKNKKR